MKRLPSRAAGGLLLFALTLLQTGCLSVKSYVDPKLPKVAYNDIAVVNKPQPLAVKFEFQTNGKANTRATKDVGGRVVRTLEASRCFAAVNPAAGDCANRLELVLNNVGDTTGAAGKGFATGLTFGAAGCLVTDGYVLTATYQAPGKPAVSKTYQHAIHSTVGNKQGPPGLEPVSLNEAVNQVVEQLVLNLLRDLQKDGTL